MSITLLALVGLTVMLAGTVPARAESKAVLTEKIRRSADFILTCQLPDGLIAMRPGPALRAIPYFANLTGLGLLRAYRNTGDRRYLDAVLRYTDWYEKHINPDGTAYDFQGTWERPESTGDYDSSDAYPATYLALCWETFRTTRDRAWLKNRFPAFVRCVEGIRLTWQADGLTFAKPDYKVKYLMDNLEVRTGLRAAVKIARTLRERDRTTAWEALLARNREGLRGLWMEQSGRFSMAMFEDGKLHQDFEKWYPDGMANAMALIYILGPRDPKARAISDLLNRHFPDAADYWRFAALWKFGPRDRAMEVREKMSQRLRSAIDHGHYLRALMPEQDDFFYREERLRLPDLAPPAHPGNRGD